jgi:hypothetical protein
MLGKMGAGWFGGLLFAGGVSMLAALILPTEPSERVLIGGFALLAFWIQGILIAASAPTQRAAWQRVLLAAALSWLGVLAAW